MRSACDRTELADFEEAPLAILVTIETIALVLLALLVAGLLRSHAEILRRLGPPEESPEPASIDPMALPGRDAAPASDIAGTTLSGEPVKLAVAGSGTSSLIAFLSSGCSTCGAFWEAFRNGGAGTLPAGTRLIVVTRDSSHESPSTLRELAPLDVPVVMSSPAWDAYAVPMTPYFVYVDGPSGQIAGEGTAEAWPQVGSLLRDALADAALAIGPNGSSRNGPSPGIEGPTGNGGAARSSRVDEELRTAGIGPAHPSLYGAGDPSDR
jgi:hypothetical protein